MELIEGRRALDRVRVVGVRTRGAVRGRSRRRATAGWAESFRAGRATAARLFFLGDDNRITVATYTVKGPPGIEFTKPRAWSETKILRTLVLRNLDLHPDGKRFAVFPRPAQD